MCFAAGIAIDATFAPGALWWLPLIVVVLWLAPRRRLPAGLLLLIAAGGLRSRAETRVYDYQEALVPRLRLVEVRGTVVAPPQLEPDRMLMEVRTDTVGVGPVALKLGIMIQAAVYSQAARFEAPWVEAGDRVRFLAELRDDEVYRNPGRLSLESFRRTRSIHALVSLKSPGLLEIEAGPRWNAAALVQRASGRMNMYWPRAHPAAALLNALVWGDRAGLHPDFVARSQSVGVYHLLVVSGMHFTLILVLVHAVGMALGFPLAARAALSGSVMVLLLLRVPFGASVGRAAVAAVSGVVLQWCLRRGTAGNLLAGAVLALLGYQPVLLSEPGLQFSVACCLVLARAAPVVSRSLIAPLAAGCQHCWSPLPDTGHSAPARDGRWLRFRLEALLERHGWLAPAYGLLRPLLALVWILGDWVVLSFLIQNETFLLSTFRGNLAPGAALVANLAMIPLTSLLTILGLILSLCPHPLYWMASAAEVLSGFCYQWVNYFDQWTLRDHPHAPGWLLGTVAAIMVAQVLFPKPAAQKALVLALLAVNCGWFFFPYRSAQAGVYFLDVGQGDCAFLLNNSGEAVLIDAGTLPRGRDSEGRAGNLFLSRSVISRALWQTGARRVLAIFVSHLHIDHFSAVSRVAWNFRAEKVILPFHAGGSPALLHFARSLPLDTQLQFAGAPHRESLGGFGIVMLHPDRAWQARSINESSMVLRIEAERQAFLFTGDMELGQERALAGRVGEIDILKVAHHGSLSSTTEGWLRELNPRVAVISVGRRNAFGHPHPEVLRRLQDQGAQVRRTDVEGYIHIPGGIR